MRVKIADRIILGFLLVLAIVYPLFSNRYMLSIGITVLTMAMLGQSWNIMSGYAGQFSFGHAAFFGLGAYTSSILYTDFGISPWVGMWFGALIACVVGVLIGFLSFRYKLRGDFFALVTLAFAEILRVLFNNTPALKGPTGILIPYRVNCLEFQFANDQTFYYVLLVMVVLATGLIGFLRNRRLGLCLLAIKGSQDAAEALGVPVLRYKLYAIGLSAALAALVGSFYAQYYGFIDPSVVFAATISVEALVPCIIGGSGTMAGPLLGALVIVPLQELSNTIFEGVGGMNMIVYGALIVFSVLFCPQGLYNGIRMRMLRKA